MFNEDSPLEQCSPTIISVQENKTSHKIVTELSPGKIMIMLNEYHSFPSQYRQMIWSYILQLPSNKAEYEKLVSKKILARTLIICKKKNCSQRTIKIFNALIQWYAPIMNCEWLPPLIERLVLSFQSDLFVFEVTMTILSSFFAEWVTEIPGPPPNVVSRIDAIFSFVFPTTRETIGSALVVWSSYRNCFAETFYHRPWLQLMDNVIASSPQFLEFLVIAWLGINSPLIKQDHESFNGALRPVDISKLIKTALKIMRTCPKNLLIHHPFVPLPSDHYPKIEVESEALVMRTLQSDQEKLAEIRKKVMEEKREAERIEKTEAQKKQTFEALRLIQNSQVLKDKQEAAQASAALNEEMNKIKHESIKMHLMQKKQFLDSWEQEWSNGLECIQKIERHQRNDQINNLPDVNQYSALENLRSSDKFIRETRRSMMSLQKQLINERDTETHKQVIQQRIDELTRKPELFLKVKLN